MKGIERKKRKAVAGLRITCQAYEYGTCQARKLQGNRFRPWRKKRIEFNSKPSGYKGQGRCEVKREIYVHTPYIHSYGIGRTVVLCNCCHKNQTYSSLRFVPGSLFPLERFFWFLLRELYLSIFRYFPIASVPLRLKIQLFITESCLGNERR